MRGVRWSVAMIGVFSVTTALMSAPVGATDPDAPSIAERPSAGRYANLAEQPAEYAAGRLAPSQARDVGPVRYNELRDAKGDGPSPARDLRALAVTHNVTTGMVRARFTLDGVPTAGQQAGAGTYIGRINDDDVCVGQAVVAAPTHTGRGEWATFDDRSGSAQVRRSGKTVTVTAEAKPLKVRAWDCAFAVLIDEEGTAYDVTGFMRMVSPDLVVFSGDDTNTSAIVGRPRKIAFTVYNQGDIVAKDVRVRVSAPKGLAVSPKTFKLGNIRVSSGRDRALTIRLSQRAAKTVSLRITSTTSATRTRRFTVHPVGKALPVGRSLAGTYFWANKFEPDFAWRNFGVAFVNKNFAYKGFPKNGMPRCTRVTGGPDKDGCVRYRWNRANGKITVGNLRGTYRKGALQLAGLGYSRMQIPKRGARWNVNLVHQGYSGCEGPFDTCTTFTYGLKLTRKGTFTSTYSSITTFRGRPTRVEAGRGRYQVGPKGQLVLRYSGGRTLRFTIGIDTDAERRPDPYRQGLVIGRTNYYD